MDNEPTIKLPRQGKPGLPTWEEDAKAGTVHPREASGSAGWQAPSHTGNRGNARPPFTPVTAEVDQMPTAPYPVRPQVKRRWPLFARVMIVVLLLLILAGGFSLVYGYYYVQSSVSTFIHPVSRGQDEPNNNVIPSDSSVAGKVWNILLLGSDNDGKYSFPAFLTQVMMVVHVDTVNNTVTMLSIPRDSWVNVPEVGGMHKIDQAFFLGAATQNSFDDGVRLARLTIEKDYGITIDRYAWVGIDGFAKVIDTLGGLDIDLTHPVVDDVYPDDTGKGANNPIAYNKAVYRARAAAFEWARGTRICAYAPC